MYLALQFTNVIGQMSKQHEEIHIEKVIHNTGKHENTDGMY